MRILWLPFLIMITGCFHAAPANDVATPALIAHATATGVQGAYVNCGVYYTDANDNPVTLEPNTVVTCQDQPLQTSGAGFSGTVSGYANGQATFTIFRPNDGSSLITTIPIQ